MTVTSSVFRLIERNEWKGNGEFQKKKKIKERERERKEYTADEENVDWPRRFSHFRHEEKSWERRASEIGRSEDRRGSRRPQRMRSCGVGVAMYRNVSRGTKN